MVHIHPPPYERPTIYVEPDRTCSLSAVGGPSTPCQMKLMPGNVQIDCVVDV